MHRCSSSHGNMVGPCTCGLFHHSQSNSFSMLFSMPNHKPLDEADMYSFTSSSSVDCTLSLGTPSTRLTSSCDSTTEKRVLHHDRRIPNFCWDILQSKHTPSPSPSPPPAHKASRGSNSNNNNFGGDPLLARRCANCDTTSTPLWRNGPRGPKSLCNACGIRFKKEERRAIATAAAAAGVGAAAGAMEAQHMLNSSWVHHPQSQKTPSFSPAVGNEFRFIEDDDRDANADAGIPFLSWHRNVTDRPSLVHDFTR